MGAFMECVTGFAVGAVFALSALRGMGLGGALAAAMALLSLTLIPWGGHRPPRISRASSHPLRDRHGWVIPAAPQPICTGWAAKGRG